MSSKKKESDIKLQTTQNNLVLEIFLTSLYMKNLGYSALNTARSYIIFFPFQGTLVWNLVIMFC